MYHRGTKSTIIKAGRDVLFSFRKIPGCNWQGLVSAREEDQQEMKQNLKDCNKVAEIFSSLGIP